MTQLQRLKRLAAMPVHSPEESEELQELVRMTTICTLMFDEVGNQSYGTLCGNCKNQGTCGQEFPNYDYCAANKGFQLRMNDENAGGNADA